VRAATLEHQFPLHDNVVSIRTARVGGDPSPINHQ
jgi:hypothetical protein